MSGHAQVFLGWPQLCLLLSHSYRHCLQPLWGGCQIVIFFPKLEGEHVGRSSGVADCLWQSLPPAVTASEAVASAPSTVLAQLNLLSLLLAYRLFTALYNTYFGDIYGRQFIVYLESLPSRPFLVPWPSCRALGQTYNYVFATLELASSSCRIPPLAALRLPALRDGVEVPSAVSVSSYPSPSP